MILYFHNGLELKNYRSYKNKKLKLRSPNQKVKMSFRVLNRRDLNELVKRSRRIVEIFDRTDSKRSFPWSDTSMSQAEL